MMHKKLSKIVCLLLLWIFSVSSNAIGLQVGALLYRTSDWNEMPGRVGEPRYDSLAKSYLQIPCAIYQGLILPNYEKATKTGHVAIYIGEIDGEHCIVEAGGNYDNAGTRGKNSTFRNICRRIQRSGISRGENPDRLRCFLGTHCLGLSGWTTWLCLH